jgi:hypothetical protein
MGPRRNRLPLMSWGRFSFLAATAVVVGVVLLAGAVVAAQGRLIGGDDGVGCLTNPAVVGAEVEEEVGISVTPSYWPLGTDCTLVGPSGRSAVVAESDWAMTAVALTGMGLGAGPVLLLPFTSLGRRRIVRSGDR